MSNSGKPILDLSAPNYVPEAEELPWPRRALKQGFGHMLPSSAFLAIPLYYNAGVLPPIRYALLGLVALLIAVLYLGSSLIASWPPTKRWLWVTTLIGALIALAATGNQLTLVSLFSPFVATAGALLLPLRHSRLLLLTLALVGAGIGLYFGNPLAIVMSVFGALMGIALALSLTNEKSQQALEREQARAALLALSAERERIARDLHDILGHSLTAISVKTELAEKLLEANPVAAAKELTEVTALAKHALADVRATTSGMRSVRLASELATARSLLTAADIEFKAPSALPVLGDAESELLGYVLREAVTNIARHSQATRCTVEVTSQRLVVADDGIGLRQKPPGRGLRGLSQRLAEADWQLEVLDGSLGTRVVATAKKETQP